MADDSKDTKTSTGKPATAGDTGAKAEQAAPSKTDGGSTLSGSDRDQRRTMQGLSEDLANEYTELGVNPALDNRVGSQRPRAAAFAPKPQQVPGPEVGHFGAHDDEVGEEFREMFEGSAGDSAGMRAEGPHGRGAE